MKSRSFVLQACALGVVTAALLLTACGGLGSGYSYPYDPPYQPSHSSGSASDSSGSSSSTPESSSSESSSEEPSSPASSEPPAPSEPELTPEQRLALYRAMQRLDADTREVMHLRLSGDFSFREIGEILGRSEVWARVRFYRGKGELTKLLGGDGDG